MILNIRINDDEWFEESIQNKNKDLITVTIPLKEYEGLKKFYKETIEKQPDKIILRQYQFEWDKWVSTEEAINEIRKLLEPELLNYARDAKIKYEESKTEFSITNYIKRIFKPNK